MQEPIDISQKVFLKLEDILKKLANCRSIDEILELNEENLKLQEYLSFLKVYKHFAKDISSLHYVSQLKTYNDTDEEIDNNVEEQVFEKELSLTNDKINSEQDKTLAENDNSEFSSEKFETEVLEELQYENLIYEAKENIDPPKEEVNEESPIISSRTSDLTGVQEEIQENKNHIEEVYISAEEAQSLEMKHQEERKFRLSNIKGVKKMETLFADDFFEDNEAVTEKPQGYDLSKSNVSLQYMEVGQTKPVFKLDLNDRIAFTKKLFSGSQSDLNNAVTRLNEFETLDEAKEYLSEIYYEKGWDKEDEFAQRLWNLVESKF